MSVSEWHRDKVKNMESNAPTGVTFRKTGRLPKNYILIAVDDVQT